MPVSLAQVNGYLFTIIPMLELEILALNFSLFLHSSSLVETCIEMPYLYGSSLSMHCYLYCDCFKLHSFISHNIGPEFSNLPVFLLDFLWTIWQVCGN